jgi:hypothetical protein
VAAGKKHFRPLAVKKNDTAKNARNKPIHSPKAAERIRQPDGIQCGFFLQNNVYTLLRR